jgi:fructosamine-3-kinase
MATRYPPILDRLERGAPVHTQGVGGGCIADARIVGFADGSSVFVKTAAAAPDMFQREAEGLSALSETGAIRVPEVLAVDGETLVLENIQAISRRLDFFECFGRALARLHRHLGPACGFANDNYIGSTPQRNEPLAGSWHDESGELPGDGSDWAGFFLERRLRFQAQLAAKRGFERLLPLLDACEARLKDLLDEAAEPPCILHGDLWGGNYIVDDEGDACLIDPAVYYGHREADLAMTHLFGGFEPSFYDAYREEYPLVDGHRERLPVYQLYHLLNHLNLFGFGYYAQCERILERFSN